MPSVNIKLFISLGLIVFAMNCTAGLFGPSNFDECVIDGAKEAKTEAAVGLVYQACKNKFPQTKHQQKNVLEDCTVIWNGNSFIKGSPANTANYKVFEFVNSTVVGYAPANMEKELLGRLIREHIDSIKRICPLN